MGRRITVHHLVIEPPEGSTARTPAQTSGHATVLDQPMALNELQLAPAPEATSDSQQTPNVPAGTTVIGDIY